MKHRLADELVARGVASPDAVATWLRAREGEAFAVWLVRHGHVHAEVVADACASAWSLPRASAEQLAGMRPAVFQRIPIEILHDAGLLPLAMESGHRLLVGVVDPAERRALEEAEFFAGVALELCVVSLVEMAEGFEAMAGRPWRVRAADVPQVRVSPGRVPTPPPTADLPTPRAPAPATDAARRIEMLPSDASVDFELTPSQRKQTDAPERLDSSELEAVEEAGAEDGDTTAGPWSKTLDDRTPWSEPGEHDPVIEGVPRRSTTGRPTVSTPTGSTPRQMRAAERRRATSGGALAVPGALSPATIPDAAVLGTVAEVARTLGDADPTAEAAMRAAIRGVRECRDRDDVARQVVEALSLVFPTALMLSLRQPHLVVWDAAMRWEPRRTVGARFEMAEGGLWDRVTSSGVSYVGPLPAGDPLRRILLSACGDQVLLLPIVLNRRPVSVLALMMDPGASLPGVGESADALCRAVAQAFKRVILRTKREPHSV